MTTTIEDGEYVEDRFEFGPVILIRTADRNDWLRYGQLRIGWGISAVSIRVDDATPVPTPDMDPHAYTAHVQCAVYVRRIPLFNLHLYVPLYKEGWKR